MPEPTRPEKHWVSKALGYLESCRKPVPHEINELDWKSDLSSNKERLIEHLIAYSNYPNGGYLVFGIANTNCGLIGISEQQIAEIITTLTNLGREAIEPPLVLDHTVIELEGVPLLIVYIPEHVNKPVHRRGKSIEETWIRSGATTRKASRHEVGQLMLNSRAPKWEELRASKLLTPTQIATQLDLTTIAHLLQRPLPAAEKELMNWLVDEKLITPDSDGYYITNFGAAAAANRLDQFEPLARKNIRVIRYRGTNKVETVDELETLEDKHGVCLCDGPSPLIMVRPDDEYPLHLLIAHELGHDNGVTRHADGSVWTRP